MMLLSKLSGGRNGKTTRETKASATPRGVAQDSP